MNQFIYPIGDLYGSADKRNELCKIMQLKLINSNTRVNLSFDTKHLVYESEEEWLPDDYLALGFYMGEAMLELKDRQQLNTQSNAKN